MNKQVEQIKAEIERLKKWCEEHTTESYSCYFDAFNDIDTFINSLEEEEEPVSKFDSCIQEGDKIVNNEDGTRFNVSQLERVAVSEDLEKAAIRIADEILPIAGREIWYGETEKNIERRKQIREGVKRGANWQKEHMMEDAITTFVFEDRLAGSPKVSVELPYPKYEFGDKVKVIIVKEE